MPDAIVDLDDQPIAPSRRRAERVAIAGLVAATVVFGAGVWIARPAIDSRLSAPTATPRATIAPATSSPARLIVPGPRGGDLPVFIRPTAAPNAPLPTFIVIFRGGPDGSYQLETPFPSPPDGIVHYWEAAHIP